MSLSKSIGYTLIGVGLLATLLGIVAFANARSMDNVVAFLLLLSLIPIGLILIGLGAIAVRK